MDVAVEWSGEKERKRKTRTRGRDDRETRDATWRRALISEICPALGLFAHFPHHDHVRDAFGLGSCAHVHKPFVGSHGKQRGGGNVEVSLGA